MIVSIETKRNLWLIAGILTWALGVSGMQGYLGYKGAVVPNLVMLAACTYGMMYFGLRPSRNARPIFLFFFPLIMLPFGLLLGFIRKILVGPHS